MAAAQNTAFAAEAQVGFESKDPPKAHVTAGGASPLPGTGSYKLVQSPTGNNLFVEAKEYDPTAHHRPRDKAHNKGQGLGFMFCCFGSQTPKNEPLRSGYELPPAGSAASLSQKQ